LENEIPQIIDEIPILCIAASNAKGVTEISGAGELKVKETDRIFSMVDNLRKLGVDISTKNNNIIVKGKGRKRFSSKGTGGKAIELNSFQDHRTAMAMCVAAASSDGSCVYKRHRLHKHFIPGFFDILSYLKR